jgi:ketosteroid isomerase-like protein
MSQANVEVVRAFFANQGDEDIRVRRLHPQLEWHVRSDSLAAHVYGGQEGFRALAARFDQVLTEQQYEPLEFIDAGAGVVVPLRWSAQASSGSGSLERSMTWVFTVEGDLIKTVVEFATKEAALEAVQLSEVDTETHTTRKIQTELGSAQTGRTRRTRVGGRLHGNATISRGARSSSGQRRR